MVVGPTLELIILWIPVLKVLRGIIGTTITWGIIIYGGAEVMKNVNYT